MRNTPALTLLATILALALLFAALANSGPAAAQTPEPSHAGDKAVLVALYNATDGDNWTYKYNWLSDEPIGEWHGITTDDEGRVTFLYLYGNNLSGAIPAELGNLSDLGRLSLRGNNLSGAIPSQLGNLSDLHELGLGDNGLTGAIPAELGNLSNLNHLYLRENQLSGAIPPELGNLPDLAVLRLAGNRFTGCIPAALADFENNDLDDINLELCDDEPTPSILSIDDYVCEAEDFTRLGVFTLDSFVISLDSSEIEPDPYTPSYDGMID